MNLPTEHALPGNPANPCCLQPGRRVEQEFLSRLITFDWAGEVSLPQTGLVEKARTGLSGFLWLLERPLVMLAGMAGVVGAVIAIRSGKRQKKTPKK